MVYSKTYSPSLTGPQRSPTEPHLTFWGAILQVAKHAERLPGGGLPLARILGRYLAKDLQYRMSVALQPIRDFQEGKKFFDLPFHRRCVKALP